MYVRINFFFIKIERSRSWFTDSGLNWSWCTADINDTTKYFQPIIIFKWKSYFNCLLFYKDGTLIYLSMTLLRKRLKKLSFYLRKYMICTCIFIKTLWFQSMSKQKKEESSKRKYRVCFIIMFMHRNIKWR